MNSFNMQTYREHCKNLQVLETSELDKIKTAFRTVTKKLRPDLNIDNAKDFISIKESYEYLKKYHSDFQIKRKQTTKYSNNFQAQQDSYFASRNNIFDTDDDLISSLIRNFENVNHKRTPSLEATLEVPFQTALWGGQMSTQLYVNVRCDCNGYYVCKKCKRSGVLQESKTVHVTIPPGTPNGCYLSLEKCGNYDPSVKHTGDIVFHVQVQSHPHFIRKKNNLYVLHKVDYSLAVLGGVTQIPLADNTTLAHTVPAGLQHDTTIVIAGQGCPLFKQPHIRGDLVVSFIIAIESSLTAQERSLITQLYAIRNEKHTHSAASSESSAKAQ